MEKVLVIGASGKIGRILPTKHLESIAPVVAMVRDGGKLDVSESIDIVEADLEKDIEFVMNGRGTVVFTAGSGADTGLDKTLLVDLWSARNAIDAAKNRGVGHFIMVSSRGADNPGLGPSRIKPYPVAKYFADQYLIHSGLYHTILRPGRLTDDEGGGINRHCSPQGSQKPDYI